MKTIRLLFGMAVVFFLAFAPLAAKAHKGHTSRHEHGIYSPYWVPNHIVRAEMRHVYFPEFDVYFDRWNGTYIYFTGRRWLTSPYRPYGLRPVDFARAHKVGLGINSSRPYVYHTRTYSSYSRYYRNNGYSYSYGNRYKHRHSNEYHQNGKKSQRRDWENDRRNDNQRDENYERRRGGRN